MMSENNQAVAPEALTNVVGGATPASPTLSAACTHANAVVYRDIHILWVRRRYYRCPDCGREWND